MSETGVMHFSIDDVSRSLRYIYEKEPESMFDLRLYGVLRQWNKTYGLKVSLYCISEFEGFDIQSFPDKYAQELSANKEWLRFGFHSRTDQPFYNDDEYKRGYINTMRKLRELGAGITDAIRLHSWIATSEQKRWLVSQGVKMIFYPYDSNTCYSDEGIFFDEGLKHQATKCWIERMADINKDTLNIGDKFVSCFTHEWCFDEQRERVEKAVILYREAGYIFV